VQSIVPHTRRPEAFTWINTASAAGIAASSALTGVLVAYAGVDAAGRALIGCVLTAVACAALSVRGK